MRCCIDDRKGLKNGLLLTVVLGALFTALQVYEYGHAAFSFSDHIYGATFFMATASTVSTCWSAPSSCWCV